jgi:hypothetical protein
MKNNKILLAILAIALVFAVTACNNGSTGSSKKKDPPPNTDPKTLTITGITGIDTSSLVVILVDDGEIPVAASVANTGSSATFQLYITKPYTEGNPMSMFNFKWTNLEADKWKGTGSYYLLLIESDTGGNFEYTYKMHAVTDKVNFQTADTSVRFSQFEDFEPEM